MKAWLFADQGGQLPDAEKVSAELRMREDLLRMEYLIAALAAIEYERKLIWRLRADKKSYYQPVSNLSASRRRGWQTRRANLALVEAA